MLYFGSPQVMVLLVFALQQLCFDSSLQTQSRILADWNMMGEPVFAEGAVLASPAPAFPYLAEVEPGPPSADWGEIEELPTLKVV